MGSVVQVGRVAQSIVDRVVVSESRCQSEDSAAEIQHYAILDNRDDVLQAIVVGKRGAIDVSGFDVEVRKFA